MSVTCAVRRKSKKKQILCTALTNVFYVRRIMIKWIINASENLVLNQDHVAVGLNEDIDPFPSVGGFFAVYRNITTYRPSFMLNAVNPCDSIQEQRSEPVWLLWVKEERENIAVLILLMRTPCNFHKGRQAFMTWRKPLKFVQEVYKTINLFHVT